MRTHIVRRPDSSLISIRSELEQLDDTLFQILEALKQGRRPPFTMTVTLCGQADHATEAVREDLGSRSYPSETLANLKKEILAYYCPLVESKSRELRAAIHKAYGED